MCGYKREWESLKDCCNGAAASIPSVHSRSPMYWLADYVMRKYREVYSFSFEIRDHEPVPGD